MPDCRNTAICENWDKATGACKYLSVCKLGPYGDRDSISYFAGLPPPKTDGRPDPTNPDHYKGAGPEVISLTRHLNFNRGNAVKYLCRAGKKDPTKELEDLKKARWYIDDEIQRLTGEGDHAK